MSDGIFSSTRALELGLDAAWLRNQVINNNIANAETPGFKASRVEFETLFARALERAQASGNPPAARAALQRVLEEARPRIVEDDNTTMRMDGNNVDIELENEELAKNALYYQTLIAKLNSELARLQMAINGGK